jgi:hypothetical protein
MYSLYYKTVPTNALRIKTMANKKIPSIFDDDSNCERPACGDISQKFRQQQLRQAIAVESRSETAATAAATEKSIATKANSQLSTDRKIHIASSVDCPVDTATLGNASWTLLHSTVCSCRLTFWSCRSIRLFLSI